MADLDRELLHALQRGDENAWNEAFRRLYPCAFLSARHPSAALTPTEAEDVAIETLSQLTGKVAQVKQFEELKALTSTMAVRRAISLQRRKYAEKRGGNQTDSLEQFQEDSQGQFEPASVSSESLEPADLRELSQLLQEALGCLDELGQKLLRDYLLEEISYKELSQRHQIPVGTVGVLLYRGLERVRTCLNRSPRLLKELKMFLRYR